MREATILKLEALRFAIQTCTSGRCSAGEISQHAQTFHAFLVGKKTSEKPKK